MVDYNYSDFETQKKILVAQLTRINMARARKHLPPLDVEYSVRTLRKRIMRHNGLISKYTGSGELRYKKPLTDKGETKCLKKMQKSLPTKPKKQKWYQKLLKVLTAPIRLLKKLLKR